MNTDILKIFSKRQNYKKFLSQVPEQRLPETMQFIFRNLPQYFEETQQAEIDWVDFQSFVNLRNPNMGEQQVLEFNTLCERMVSYEGDEQPGLMRMLNDRVWAMRLSETAHHVGMGEEEASTIEEQFRQWQNEKAQNGDSGGLSFVDTSVSELLNGAQDYTKYFWPIDELNSMLGPISKGDFIIVAGRPDSGKTTILSNAVLHFASQLLDNQCILWCNNEEGADRVKTRQLQAALGWTNDELLRDKEATQTAAEKTGFSKIKLMDNSSMSIHDIEAHIEACNPSIIIIDQIWKVSGFEKESENLADRYGKLAQYVRGLAKKYGPVIGASQLDATAEGVKYPTMGSLYNSKTSVQGESDAIVTIGHVQGEEDIRYLRAPKNKLRGAHPKMRNMGCAVRIDKERAKLVSLNKDAFDGSI
jgi:hypothetical protein